MSITDDRNKTIEEKIKKMVEDAGKGLATNKELLDGIKEAIAKEFDAMANESEMGRKAQEAQEQLKAMETEHLKLKAQLKDFLEHGGDMGKPYKNFSSLEQAKTFGLFIMASILRKSEAIESLKTKGIEIKAMADSNASGEFLVPQQFIDSLIVMQEQYGVFRADTTIWPMASDKGSAPVLTKGLTVYCPGKGVTPTESELVFAQLELIAQKWMTFCLLNNETMEDAAVELGVLISDQIARAMAEKEDQCAFNGDGTSTYFGIVGLIKSLYNVNTTVASNPGLHVQGTAGAWSAIDTDDFLSVAGILPSFAEANAAWYCNKRFYYTAMLAAAMAAGGVTGMESVIGLVGNNPTYLGHKVRFTQVMPATKPAADHCPVLFGDLKQAAVLGERRQRTMRVGTEVKMLSDQTAIVAAQRIAIAIGGQKTTNAAGSDAAGAYVGLWADIA